MTVFLYLPLAQRRGIFTAEMTTYYCPTLEDALLRAKKAVRKRGAYYGGITLRSGRKGFAVYSEEGKELERYSVLGRDYAP